MKNLQIFLLLAVLLLGCSGSAPNRESSVTPPFGIREGHGTLMGCRALAVYFAAHETVNELGIDPLMPTPVAVEMYQLLYETYRATRLSETDNCSCLLRRMVTDKEAHGMDVPDLLDINPLG